ncbi:MAG: 3'-5' exonuclease [Campylobacteraceae bacterium]|jgi:predicted PolB exonuclease-like 3'-5' exonuclease|nr:3'-5' exonuclease [Campylobacteraceae bacterium]
MVCVFDCETIPDFDLIRDVFGYEGGDGEVAALAMKEQKERSGSDFLAIPFHRVTAISAVVADDFGMFIRVNSMEGQEEKEMISAFLSFIDKKNPKLVSFNGRSFDLPMLMARAMRYNFSCQAYFEVENREFGKSKWDNYRYRYSERFHVDLMDHISDFGAVRGLKLDHLCTMAGLPGKYDVSGDQVMDLYLKGEIEKIKEYCESDTLNTYWLYLKYELLKGNITLEDYKRSIFAMSEKMPKSRGYYEIFADAIKRELDVNKSL